MLFHLQMAPKQGYVSLVHCSQNAVGKVCFMVSDMTDQRDGVLYTIWTYFVYAVIKLLIVQSSFKFGSHYKMHI